MRSRTKILVGGGVLAFAVGLGLVGLLGTDRAVVVRAEVVGKQDIVATITATGQVRARRQVNISSDVMGRVVGLEVVEGQEVEQGQILLTIDPRQVEAAAARARASLAQAEAQVAQQRASLAQAERELARLANLRAGGVVTAQELEESETRVEVQQALLEAALHGVDQARAALDEAEEQRSRTVIRAPMSGRVIRLNIEEGETAVVGTMNNPGSLLLTIGDLSVIEAVLSVDETDVPFISVGDSAVVELDAFPRRTFASRVATIGNSAIQGVSGGSGGGTPPTSVNFEVVLTLLERPADLRPDLSATADIIVDRKEGALGVPIISVTLDGNERITEAESGSVIARARASNAPDGAPREGVFVIRGGRAVWTPIVLGVTGQEYFEVVSGLSAGEEVVSGPYQTIRQLRDGDPVRREDGSSPSR